MLSYKYNCDKCGWGTDSMLSMSMHIGGCVLKRSGQSVGLIIAIIALVFMLIWLPLEISAQSPEPPPECIIVDGQQFCISHAEATPGSTHTPGPPPVAPTATPTIVIQPLPQLFVYLSLIYR